ncbi:MAG: glycosyltransferase [Bdellovibrionales bacterium]|nr:glycosyltransferase [Bdellovibrionales bacterium]
MLHRLRVWDRVSSVGVDHFIGISEFISRRIWRCYRRESSVIYPPVDTESFPLLENKSDFYLVLGRMVPYKKVDLIARAFKRMPNRKLVLAGNGPDYARIADMVKDAPNIVMTGFIPHTQAVDLMQRAKAFVFAAEEDFGIAPLEASACGTPVIAYRSGGASETIRDIALPEPSGLFFDRQTEDSLIAAVKKFEIEGHAIKPAYCRKQAMRFSRVVFREKIEEYLEAAIRAYQEDKAG